MFGWFLLLEWFGKFLVVFQVFELEALFSINLMNLGIM